MAFSALSLNHFIKNGLYWPLSAFIENCLYQELFALLLYRKGLLSRIFVLSLHQKRPLSRIFCFIAISKTAFIKDFSLYCFICLYQPLSKIAFFALSLYCFIENSLYLPLSKTVFFPLSLYRFIKNGLYWPLSKLPLLRIFY